MTRRRNKRRQSGATKKNQILATLFFWLSTIVVVAPYVVFGIMAAVHEPTWYFWLFLAMAVILFFVDLIRHSKVRVSLWVALLALMVVFPYGQAVALVAVLAGCNFVDEYILWPLYRSFKSKERMNREIDIRRGM